MVIGNAHFTSPEVDRASRSKAASSGNRRSTLPEVVSASTADGTDA